MRKGYSKSTITDYAITALIIIIGVPIIALCFYGAIYMLLDFLSALKS